MDPVTVLSLVTLCISSSATLYDTIDGLQTRSQDFRHLKGEVHDLNIVLQAVVRNLEQSTEDFETLRLILEQCNQACKTFEATVLRYTSKSERRLDQIRAQIKLQFAGGNIDNFRKLINSYKSTLTIALADANLRTMQVSKELLEEYTEMIHNTTTDLEEQIDLLNKQLAITLQRQGLDSLRPTSDPQHDETGVMQHAEGQKAGLQECIGICNHLLGHIDSIRQSMPSSAHGDSQSASDCNNRGVEQLAPRLVVDALQMCTHNLSSVEQHLRDLHSASDPENTANEHQIMHQISSARHCLGIVEDAQKHRVNVFTNINTAEDSFQTVVSTVGDLIKADGLTIGARATNIMGQMSDESLQKVTLQTRPLVAHQRSPDGVNGTFEKKHGFGYTMQAKAP